MLILSSNRVVEVDGCSFEVRPERYEDLFVAADQAAKLATETGIDDDRYAGVIMSNMSLVNRIVGWGGIGSAPDHPAECNRENKLALFAQRRDILGKIAVALQKQEQADSGNLATSHGGCR